MKLWSILILDDGVRLPTDDFEEDLASKAYLVLKVDEILLLRFLVPFDILDVLLAL